MSMKYYKGFAVEADQEVPAESTKGLAHYAKAFFESSGQLDKVELYNQGHIQRVDYYGARTEESVKTLHREYKGVGFTIHLPLEKVGGFSWEQVAAYDSAGELESITAVLQDKQQHGWMEVQRTANAQVYGVVKYFWESPTVLRYVFEYDEDGELVSVYDLVHSESTSFQEAKKALVDSHFFERGFTLPQEIGDTPIPH